jgi:type IV secretory pathway VirJ component
MRAAKGRSAAGSRAGGSRQRRQVRHFRRAPRPGAHKFHWKARLNRLHRIVFATLIVAIISFEAHAQTVAAAASSGVAHVQKAPPKAKRKAPPPHDPQAYRYINVAGFGEVAVYKPAGESRGLALFASGDGGWNLGVLDMAHEAAELGYWVAGFSTPQFLKAPDGDGADCSDADGLLIKLGAELVREFDLPRGTKPIVIGYSSGATIVYAALAADAGDGLGGGVSLGFCPDLLIKKPFCAGRGGLTQQKQQQSPFGYVFDKRETVKAPWRILQGDADQICDPKFAAEFAEGQTDAKAVMLPKVGHGFGVPKNWMSQYRDSLGELLGSPHE